MRNRRQHRRAVLRGKVETRRDRTTQQPLIADSAITRGGPHWPPGRIRAECPQEWEPTTADFYLLDLSAAIVLIHTETRLQATRKVFERIVTQPYWRGNDYLRLGRKEFACRDNLVRNTSIVQKILPGENLPIGMRICREAPVFERCAPMRWSVRRRIGACKFFSTRR
jgi:hypothetical protein